MFFFLFQMRNYIRKTTRVQNATPENASKAIELVRKHNWGICNAARKFQLSERSLSRYLSANKEVDVEIVDNDSLPLSCGYSSRKVIMFKHLFLVIGKLTSNFLKTRSSLQRLNLSM